MEKKQFKAESQRLMDLMINSIYTHKEIFLSLIHISEEIRATLVNLFEGKIVCADCGKKMYFHRKRIDKDKRKRWYA